MTVAVKIMDGKYRIVEEGTNNIAITKNGSPLDGGGHSQIDKAIRQAGKINIATNFAPTKEKKE